MSEPSSRRDTIMLKAAELFAKEGITGTTVREIADAVGVLSGSLYHHFKSKDEIVSAIVTQYLEDLTAQYREVVTAHSDPRSQLTELVHRSLRITGAHPYATEIYQLNSNYLSRLKNYDYIKTAAATISSTWVSVIEAGVASGAFRPDVNARVSYRLIRDSLWLSVRWLRPTEIYTLEQFGDDLVSLFLEGMLPR